MTRMRLLIFVAAALAPSVSAARDPLKAPILEPGLYEIRYRQELPHLESYAVERVARLCVDGANSPPVLSGNGAFQRCRAQGFPTAGGRARFTIVCPGKAGARAEARYAIGPDAFEGRVDVKLGAKNMTLTEVQKARRIGPCPDAAAPAE